MDKFTASNGIKVWATIGTGLNGGVIDYRRSSITQTKQDEFDALGEFFRAVEDERLGRWRWPENPDYVVYRVTNNAACVINEKTGETWEKTRELVRLRDALAGGAGLSDMHLALFAYFESHPERKPWEDAKEGDVWAVGIEGQGEIAMRVDAEGLFRTIPGGSVVMDPWFTAARRIWPEGD